MLLRVQVAAVLILLLFVGLPARAAQTLPQPITLTAPTSAADDRFGEAVAVDGNFIVVGSPGRKAVDIFQQDGSYMTTLTPQDADGADFGSTVDISGSTIVIGAHENNGFAGAVYISTHSGGSWSLPVKLAPAGLEAGDNFGHSVAIDGDMFVAGAQGDDDQGGSAGAVYVYERENGVWTNTGKLYADAAQPGDFFGWDVDIDGSTVIAGAIFGKAAHIFEGGVFQATLTASDQYFGAAVAVSGNQAMVGAYGADSSAGRVYSFIRDSADQWTQQNNFRDATTSAGDEYGAAVALDSGFAIVGAPQHLARGAAYLLQDNCPWERFDSISGSSPDDEYGTAVAVDDGTAVIGKPGNTGAVDVYTVALTRITHTVAAGDVTGLIDAMTCANATPNADIIELTSSTYTLTAADNTVGSSGNNGLPGVISTGGALTINGNGAVIERDTSAPAFRLLAVAENAQLILSSVTLRAGEAGIVGGALLNKGTTIIESSVIADSNADGYGGGVYNDGGTLTIRRSTINGNSASVGGGIYTIGGTLTIYNTTFYNNSAGTGGGIDSQSDTVLLNSTLHNNTATSDIGGVRRVSGSFEMKNTILDNSNGDCSGDVTGDSNLITGATTCTSLTNILTGAPLFDSLTTAPNGTGYFPLLAGSPAVNAGNNQVVTDAGLTQDQPGNARIVWGTVDMGAAEFPLSVIGPDVNGDGVVSPADAIYVINRLGISDPTADVDGNGAITQDDVQQVLSQLGTSPGNP